VSSYFSSVGAPLSASHVPGAAYGLVEGTVTSRAVPRMVHLILSPPLFAVWLRPFLCPSPRGGGSIRRELGITSSHGTQDAQAQADQQQTCHHVQAPFRATCSRCCVWPRSMTAVDVQAGHRHVREGGKGRAYTRQAPLPRTGEERLAALQGTMPELFLLTSLSTSMPKSGATQGDTPRW
jgi:hypothetical protein